MNFDRDGAERAPGVITPTWLARLEAIVEGRARGPGVRLVGQPHLAAWIEDSGVLGAARARIGSGARAVRAILFDKGKAGNWTLGWHQDRTIAVARREEVQGFEAWTVKSGIDHVEPPFALIERMATVRVHLDDVPEDNAPLLIVPGSHRLERLGDERVTRLGATGPSVSCLAARGDAWWYRTAIVHASARSSGVRRRVLQIDFSADELPAPLEWRAIA